MTLVDSSVWIELFRATGSPAHSRLKSALDSQAELATTDVIMMEVLAGARDDADRDWLRRLLYNQHFLPVDGPADYESAAELYRLCRRGGETPRQLADCLIAVVAIRNDVELLCCDADFQAIARHAPLRVLGA
ncbi:MAG TPA: PIN domain nuclease [Solirubrobacterales bacterium]|nr:PIN domain nuclease [Solirubrobacterales bacterium]